MAFNSFAFLVFVIIAAVGYYWIPRRFQWVWLLGFSYLYYLSYGTGLVGYLLFTTVTTWLGAGLLEHEKVKESKKTKNTNKNEESKTIENDVIKKEQMSNTVLENNANDNRENNDEDTNGTRVQEEKKSKDKVTKEPTPSDLAWCAEGGTHHIAGEGANEHGYYSSWNEAQIAFENYTKGWPSVQYKISQCLCGKYYFWAIK